MIFPAKEEPTIPLLLSTMVSYEASLTEKRKHKPEIQTLLIRHMDIETNEPILL